MRDSTRRALIVLAPVIVIGQFLTVTWVARNAIKPVPPNMDALPTLMSGWRSVGELPIDPAMRDAVHADRLLSRTYVNQRTGLPVSFLSAWFQSQTEGNRQPHSPKVCLPGSGWVQAESGSVDLLSRLGPLKVNRYIVTNRGQRAVVLYWYQTPMRTIASEWAAKFWLFADALRDGRTDVALVRVVVWNLGRTDEETVREAVAFSEAVHPLVSDLLPL